MSFKTPKGTELPIMNLKGKDYLQVAHRLVWFREECKNWRIVTVPVKLDSDIAVFRAEIYEPGEAGEMIASAHKSENPKSFKNYIEKAETGAVGRALAFCGFGTQFCADELDEGDELADAPTGRAKIHTVLTTDPPQYQEGPPPDYDFGPTTEPMPPKKPAAFSPGAHPQIKAPSPAQVKRLFAIAASAGWPNKDLKDYVKSTTGAESSNDIPLAKYDELCRYIEAHPYKGR